MKILCILAIFHCVSPHCVHQGTLKNISTDESKSDPGSSPQYAVVNAAANEDADVHARLYHDGPVPPFPNRLYSELVKNNPEANIFYSPLSIQTCLGMTLMGAEGETANELIKGLALSAQTTDNLAQQYHHILEKYQNSPIVKIANKIYINQGNEVQEKFNETLTKQFFAAIEDINFNDNQAAARTINSWMESKTNRLIKDFISSDLLGSDTSLVLVNAIYFKGEWVNRFNEEDTQEMDFFLNATNPIKVQMMTTKATFNLYYFKELGASVLQMPYRDCNLSMLIFLPHEDSSLYDLEKKLENVLLSDIAEDLLQSLTEVEVFIPKFKVEFEVELSEPLINMGMRRMFSPGAELGKMVNGVGGLHVSSVVHKAVIEVNEKGSEAAAATADGFSFRSGFGTPEFVVNRPFCYIIKDELHNEVFKGSIKTKF